MKKIHLLSTVFCLVLIGQNLSAQNQDEMKAYMEYMAPGPIQQMMAKSVGTWTSTSSMWMKEGTPPMISTMETKNEMILGGRYLQATSSGKMWDQAFTGVSTTGYDNALKIFVNTWIDNMGTGIIFMKGDWDATTRSIRLTGKMTDAVKKTEIPVREVITFTDDNHQVLEMFFTAGDKEFKSLEIKSVRK